MTPQLFPNRFNILLDADERGAFDDLFELDADVEPVELLHKAIRAGIKALNVAAEARRKDPDRPPTRTEVEASKRSLAHRVENYIGCPIVPRQQAAINHFLNVHPGMQEEEAISMLLDLGIQRAQGMAAELDAPTEDASSQQSAAMKRADQRVRLAEDRLRRATRRFRS